MVLRAGYNLRVTDLMQGPVYGFETKVMRSNTKLSRICITIQFSAQ